MEGALDPFVGAGTVLLESEYSNVESIGIEAHPFIARVAKTKLLWRENAKAYRDYCLSILDKAKLYRTGMRKHPRLIEKCFSITAISRLDSLLDVWSTKGTDSPYSELAWLTLASIIRECASVGTAQWQYVLPAKSKKNALDPFEAFELKVNLISQDKLSRQNHTKKSKAVLLEEDARTCSSVPDNWAELVITSPPYVNNYDYADATRLKMSFFGDIDNWGDLQDSVRKYLIRSCTQHVAGIIGETHMLLSDPILNPIHNEIEEVCRKLDLEREKHGGKKPYHTMIAAYFNDMARVWRASLSKLYRDERTKYITANPGFDKDNDARITIFSKCLVVIQVAWICYMFRTLDLKKGWWDNVGVKLKILGMETQAIREIEIPTQESDRQLVTTEFERFLAYAYLLLLFTSMESSLRIIVGTVYPNKFRNKEGKFEGNFEDIARSVLTNYPKYENFLSYAIASQHESHEWRIFI